MGNPAFLGGLIGYAPPNPQGEGGGGDLSPLLNLSQHPLFLLLPLVVGFGGMLSGLIVFTLAPEAEGHGTDAAIAAFHYEEGRVRARIPLIKLVASAITIGSGGSSGREGPTAQISAGFGSLLARWLSLSATDRRIAVAAGIGAGIIVGKHTIYTSQLESRANSPAHRLRLSFPLLATLLAREAMTPMASQLITPDSMIAAVEAVITTEGRSGVVVRGAGGTMAGVVTLADVRRVPEAERAQTPVAAVMTREPISVSASEPLDAAMERLTKARIRWAPVIEKNMGSGPGRPIGVISVASVMDTYHRALAQGTRRMRSLVEGTILVEVTVTPESALAGKTLRQLHLPPQTLVVSVRRGGALVFPRADTELRSGDAVTFLTNPTTENKLRAYLAGPQADHIPDENMPAEDPDNPDSAASQSSLMRGVSGLKKRLSKPRVQAGSGRAINQNESQTE